MENYSLSVDMQAKQMELPPMNGKTSRHRGLVNSIMPVGFTE